MRTRLSILVCTYNDRIKDVPALLLPPRPDVCYVVSFQFSASMFLDMIPPELKERPDVKLCPLPNTGLSANRNNALRHCETELALIADDDLRYTNAQLDMVIEYFTQHPEVDVACFQAVDFDGTPMKTYPPKSFDYEDRPKGSSFSSWEIAFRADAPLPAFDTRFGLGAVYLCCGEEEIFIHQAHHLGARVRYVPQVLCTVTMRETTGTRFLLDAKVRRSKGAVLYMMHGVLGALLRITKVALQLPSTARRWAAWKDMFDGMRYILNNPLNEGVADEIPLQFDPIDHWNTPNVTMS
ncbi:MAG: glycosyltransferase [Bacteroidaceae bacterium]|nr:glycosyltransferase [Bacteroidaceae bacterium]